MTNRPNRSKSTIEFAFIQSGYCVFGAGHTKGQAIADAREWLESENGEQGGMTLAEVRALLTNDRVDGGFRVISSNDAEFDSYLKNQGGYSQRNGEWFAD